MQLGVEKLRAEASASDSDRKIIAKEIKSLFDQIDYTATSTRYNGKHLLTPVSTKNKGIDNGAASADASGDAMLTFHFQIGDDTNGVITGVKFQNMTIRGLGLRSYTNALTTAMDAKLSNEGVSSRSLAILRTEGLNSADAFIKALDTALETALGAAADIGAYEQRLGYTADNVATQIENLEASDSTIRSSDMAKEITEYMKWSVLSQASQYMLAQSNQNAFSALNLLQ